MYCTRILYELSDSANQLKEANDCTVRAFAICFNTTYQKAHDYLKYHGRKSRKGMLRSQLYNAFCNIKKSDIEVIDCKRMNVNNFIKQYPSGTFYVLYNNHAVAIIDGIIHDCRDSGRRFVEHAWRINLDAKTTLEKITPIRVIVAGGRDFNNYSLVQSKLDHLFSNMDKSLIEIVDGGAKGADTQGWRYSKEVLGKVSTIFNADWEKYGKTAGPIRNKQMAEYSTHLVLFWDGKSKGSKNMLDTAKELGLNIRIVNY